MPGHHGKSGTSAGVSQGQHHGDVAHQPGGRLHTANTKTITTNLSTGNNGSKVKTKRKIGEPKDYQDTAWKAPVAWTGPITAAINVGSYLGHRSRKKFARKEGLYREYYIGNQYKEDPSKRTLKPNTPEGKAYLKEAGYGKSKMTGNDRDGPGRRCPDGSAPPCPPATSATAAKPAITPYKPYYMGFDYQKPMDASTHKPLPDSNIVYNYKKGGLSGGKRYGPPPKKGPNPHGKCPNRPDGIRGVGAVQPGRGVKFVGVK